MARPHIDDKEKRIVQVNIRLTLDENEKVNHYASASGMSPANWIRKKVFSGKFPAINQSPLDTAIYQELRKIGVNLNQAVHKLNKGELDRFFFKYIMELQAKINELIKILIDDGKSG